MSEVFKDEEEEHEDGDDLALRTDVERELPEACVGSTSERVSYLCRVVLCPYFVVKVSYCLRVSVVE